MRAAKRRRAIAQERRALAGEDVGQVALDGGDVGAGGEFGCGDMGIHGLISYVDSGNLRGHI